MPFIAVLWDSLQEKNQIVMNSFNRMITKRIKPLILFVKGADDTNQILISKGNYKENVQKNLGYTVDCVPDTQTTFSIIPS